MNEANRDVRLGWHAWQGREACQADEEKESQSVNSNNTITLRLMWTEMGKSMIL